MTLKTTSHTDPSSLSLPIHFGPQLFLICGFIGSGKTTISLELADREKAVRLTLDEWVNKLYGAEASKITEFDPQERVKEVMWQVAEGCLRLGTSVVLDWGFWAQRERDTYRKMAEAIGATPKLIFVDCCKQQCLERVLQRNLACDERSVIINPDELELWWRVFEPPLGEECDKKST